LFLLIVFSGDTIETAEYWIKELREKENPYAIVMVGNKSDLVKDLGAATEAGRALAEQVRYMCVCVCVCVCAFFLFFFFFFCFLFFFFF
jgi:hypothetical protein